MINSRYFLGFVEMTRSRIVASTLCCTRMRLCKKNPTCNQIRQRQLRSRGSNISHWLFANKEEKRFPRKDKIVCARSSVTQELGPLGSHCGLCNLTSLAHTLTLSWPWSNWTGPEHDGVLSCPGKLKIEDCASVIKRDFAWPLARSIAWRAHWTLIVPAQLHHGTSGAAAAAD